MPKLLSPQPVWQNCGIAFVRIFTGILLIYHGKEIFEPATMQGYADWDMFKINSNPLLLPYVGKTAEFIAGILLTLGLLTRIACIITMGNFIYITFFVGHGKFWYDDQHPFMFVLIALALFFTGPGAISMDGALFKKKSQ